MLHLPHELYKPKLEYNKFDIYSDYKIKVESNCSRCLKRKPYNLDSIADEFTYAYCIEDNIEEMKRLQTLILDTMTQAGADVEYFRNWIGTQDAFYEDNAYILQQLACAYTNRFRIDENHLKPLSYSVYMDFTKMQRDEFKSVMRTYNIIYTNPYLSHWDGEFREWYNKYYNLEVEFWNSYFPRNYFYSEYDKKISQSVVEKYRLQYLELERRYPFYKSILETVKFE